MIPVGYNIKKIRELRGYSQEYLATKLNISQKQLSLYESDKSKIDIHKLDKFAAALDVDPFSILTFDEKHFFNNCTQSGNFYNSNIYASSKQESHQKDEIILVLRDEINLLKKLLYEK